MSEKRSCCCGALPSLWWWLLTLLGLPLLFWFMIHSRQAPVETDLTARTTDGLKAASLNDVQVNLDHRGRDAQLTGKVSSDAEREQALKLVQDTYGIRVVDNAIEVAAPVAASVTAVATAVASEPAAANTAATAVAEPTATNAAPVSEPAATSTAAATPEPGASASVATEPAASAPTPPTAEPSFALLAQDGKWVLQGSLSSQEEINQAVSAAEQMYGAGNVVNQLTVASVAPAAWLTSLGSLKEVLANLEQSGLKFANGAFTLMGVASSEQAKADVTAKVQQLLGSVNLDNQITVKVPEAAASATEVAPTPTTTEPAATAATTEPVAPTTTATNSAEPAPAAGTTTTAATPEPAAAPPATEPAPTAPAPVQLTSEQQSCQDRIRGSLNGRQILFETNKATIKEASLGLLDNLAKVANECKSVLTDKIIRVGGHTDDRGEDAYNQNLSQQRADAVKDYLSKQGVDAGLIQGVGYGETQPIASNETDAGRAQNRRISFDIIQK